MIRAITAGLLTAAVSISAAAADTDDIFTLSVQTVPAGAGGQVAVTRAGFLDLITSQGGLVADDNFWSFFTFPEPPAEVVLVGFTQWSDREAMSAARDAVMSGPVAGAYMGSVEMQALVPLVTADGESFDLGAYVDDPNTVIEFAVRRPKDGQEDAFIAAREAFFAQVGEQPGNLFYREFVMPEGASELIGGDSNWTAVLIGWDSAASFQTALGALVQQPELGAFQATIDTLVYHATVPQ